MGVDQDSLDMVAVFFIICCPSVADPGFPRGGGANPQGGGTNLLFGKKFPENCMKMKEFGPGGRMFLVPTPLRSANAGHTVR